MKINKSLIKGIVIGLVIAMTFSMFMVPGLAATVAEKITVYTGITLNFDGNKVIPTDAEGKEVEPFIYDGTTYLPVRAVSNLFGEEISWDGKTKTVYIGEKPVEGTRSYTLDELKEYVYSNSSDYAGVIKTGEDAKFTVLDDEVIAFNAMLGSRDITFKLDSEFESISGKFGAYNFYLGKDLAHTLKFYNVDRYGTQTLIAEYKINNADEPIDIDVDLVGVNFLRIVVDRGYLSSGAGSGWGYPVFYNITMDKFE